MLDLSPSLCFALSNGAYVADVGVLWCSCSVLALINHLKLMVVCVCVCERLRRLLCIIQMCSVACCGYILPEGFLSVNLRICLIVIIRFGSLRC